MRLLPLLLLAACGRPLTPNETALLASLHGPSLAVAEVRLHEPLARGAPRILPAPPRLTCQSRLFPPPAGPTIRATTGAVAIYQDVHVRADLYREDFAAGWPETLDLADAMLLAHEMVHVWQWQNREVTGYHPLRAAFEHVRTPDPYLFELEARDYLDYGYEQQGSIMEEYVCCRTLAPEAGRTARLHAMLDPYFALTPLGEPLTSEGVWLPWDGVEVEGICGP